MKRPARSKTAAYVLATLALAFSARHAAAVDDSLNDDPQVERKLLQLPEGFDIQLYASDPDVIHPITLDFDAQGRCWALCLPRYPQMLAGQPPADFITILGKPDRNGHAESVQKFAEGLTIPTGMALGNGGVYVGEGDSLVFLKNEHDKAGPRKVLLTGFGTEDMHHAVNTFRWGPDGYLYFDQGLYALSSMETPQGLRRFFGGCIWQFNPRTNGLEVNDRQVVNNNAWGHIFDAFGRPLFSSGWISDINLVLPETPLSNSGDAEHVPPVAMTRLAGERNCGLEFINTRQFPDDWQNNLVTGGFNSQAVYRYQEEEGAGHVTVRELPPLIVSRHVKFRPVDVKVGPDGALYVADWYNLIIQHNQVDFRDPRRDHDHGRIWRITYKGRPLVPLVDFSQPTAALLDHLKDPEPWTRNQVRRQLAMRDPKEVTEALGKWAASIQDGGTAAEHDLLEALWTYQTLNVVEPALLTKLLRANDSRVRVAAVTVLGYWYEHVPDAMKLLAAAANDDDMQVRLYAVLAAERMPSAEAFDAALAAVDRPTDPVLDFELRKLALVLQPYWYPPFQAGKLALGGDAKRVSFALVAVRAGDAAPRLLELMKSGKIPADRQAELLVGVAALGDPKQLAAVLSTAIEKDRLDPDDQVRVMNALADAAAKRKVFPENADATLNGLIDRSGPIALAAIKVVGAMKLESMQPHLQAIASKSPQSTHRRAAMSALAEFDPKAANAFLTTLAGPGKPHGVRIDATVSLAATDDPAAVKLAADILHESGAEDVAPLFNVLIRKKDGARQLAEAMKDLPPAPDAAKIGLRELRVSGNLASPLTAVLSDAADIATNSRQSSPEELKKLVALVQKHGDPARGEALFRSANTSCMSCHAIAGAGADVGPDLAQIGTAAQVDFLVEHILQPNKHVKDGYAAYAIDTNSGDSFTGIQLRETPEAYILRDATHEEMAIAKSDVKKRRAIGTLMPSGLADALTDNELADLVRFLSELGKPGPYNVGQAQVERRWLVMEKVPSLEDTDSRGKLLADKRVSWARHFTNVAGELPLIEVAAKRKDSIVLRGMLDVTAAGPLAIDVKTTGTVQLWIDGVSTPTADERVPLNLPVGKHTLDFWVSTTNPKAQSFHCQLADLPNSTGRGRWVDN